MINLIQEGNVRYKASLAPHLAPVMGYSNQTRCTGLSKTSNQVSENYSVYCLHYYDMRLSDQYQLTHFVQRGGEANSQHSTRLADTLSDRPTDSLRKCDLDRKQVKFITLFLRCSNSKSHAGTKTTHQNQVGYSILALTSALLTRQ